MINLKKVHGSQNSFFILDQTLLTTPLTEQELVTSVSYTHLTLPTTF